MKRAEIVRKSDEYGRGCDRECYRKYPREYDRKYDREEAVSTVVAVMLILAILATCISVYTSTYVPGLKQQAEIMHSQSVEQAFLRFASGVDNIYGQKKPAKFSEPVVLGGGDVLLSSVKSGGMIEITDFKAGELLITGDGSPVDTVAINSTCVKYTPYFSSWENQGYLYRKGTVWVTKNNETKTAPASLSLNSVNDGYENEKNTIRKYFEGMADTWRTYPAPDLGTANAEITIVTMNAVKPDTISGSGSAVLVSSAVEDSKEYVLEKPGEVILKNTDGYGKSMPFAGNTTLTLKILRIEVYTS